MFDVNHRTGANELPTMTEPLIVPEVFVEGVEIEAGRHTARFVAWAYMKTLDAPERRIVARLVMPIDVAREFAAAIVAGADEMIDNDTRREFDAAKSRDRALDN